MRLKSSVPRRRAVYCHVALALSLFFALPVKAQISGDSADIAEVKQAFLEAYLHDTSFSPSEIAGLFRRVSLVVIRFEVDPNHLLAVTWTPPADSNEPFAEGIDISSLRAHLLRYQSSEEPILSIGPSSTASLVKVTESPITFGLTGAYLDPNLPRDIRSYLFHLMQPTRHTSEGQQRVRLRWILQNHWIPISQNFASGFVWQRFLEEQNAVCGQEMNKTMPFASDHE